MSDQVNVTDDAGVRWIEINRPDTKNGLTPELNGEVIEAIGQADESKDLRVLVLGGAGGSFSSGLDLKAATQRNLIGPGGDLMDVMEQRFHGLIRAIRNSPMPTIAAVDGVAAGFGCDIALACDMRILSERARFTEIFVRRGLVPDGGGTFFLPRLVGVGRALELMYTGDIIDANTAVRLGIGNQVLPTDEFHDGVWAMAKKLAKGAPLAMRLIKQMVYAGLDGTLDDALEREKNSQKQCLESKDFGEGVLSFMHKREPNFTGE